MKPTENKPRWDVALRARLEIFLESWGHTVTRHRWLTIALSLCLALALSSQAMKIRIDTSTEAFLLPGDPVRVAYAEFREQFGLDETIIMEIVPPEVFSLEFLAKLRSFHRALEERVPHVEEVTSLINVRETRGEGDRLIVSELLEALPTTEVELIDLKQRVLANPLYRDVLISPDGRFTAVLLQAKAFSQEEGGLDEFSEFEDAEEASTAPAHTFLTGEEREEVMAAVDAVIDEYMAPDFEIHFTGGPVVNQRLSEALQQDMRVFLLCSIALIAVLLYTLFRRFSAVLLPLGVVLLSVSSTIGAMGITRIPLGVASQIMPSFLLAVGISASVHLLVVFFQSYDAGASREDALAHALAHSGLAIIMTSLTTAGGLISFVVAEVAPVAVLGIFTPIGIVLGLSLTLILLPALLAVVPLKRKTERERGRAAALIERFLRWIGDRSVDHPWTVIVAMSIILLVSIAGITQLKFEYDPIRWYPEDNVVRMDVLRIDREMGGSHSLEVVIDSGEENGLLKPEVLNAMEALHTRLGEMQGGGGIYVTKSISLVDVLKEIHQALNENDPAFHAIPQDPALIAQEILLFESSGSDDLEDFVDSEFRIGRLTIKIPYVPPAHFYSFVQDVGTEAQLVFGELASVHITGFVAMLSRSMDVLRISLTKSYLIALLIITPLMILVLGDLRAGLTAMVPNLAPILLTLGLMGWFGIPLDSFTLLIGSIAIGLAVDDTIHFMHNYRKYFEKLGNPRAAVRETLRTTGNALLTTSVVLSLAFFIYMFASLDNFFYFGLFTGFTILTAFIADVTISPAVMTLLSRSPSMRQKLGRPEVPGEGLARDLS